MIDELETIDTSAISGVSPSRAGFFDFSLLPGVSQKLQARMAKPEFWNNKESAQADVGIVSELRGKIQPFLSLESRRGGP